MVKTSKQNLKLLTLLFIEKMDEGSAAYERACDLMLTMMGISDAQGNLTEEYAESPYWEGGVDGQPLQPSSYAEIKAMLPPELWGPFDSRAG